MNRFDGRGDERDESEMLLFPPPPALPLPRPDDDLEDFGVDGACLLWVDEGEDGGGVPDLLALASRAAFWLLRPKGERAAADERFGAGDGILSA